MISNYFTSSKMFFDVIINIIMKVLLYISIEKGIHYHLLQNHLIAVH